MRLTLFVKLSQYLFEFFNCVMLDIVTNRLQKCWEALRNKLTIQRTSKSLQTPVLAMKKYANPDENPRQKKSGRRSQLWRRKTATNCKNAELDWADWTNKCNQV